MPFSQNWTFCRAFSPLDVAHVSKGRRPTLRAGMGPAHRRWTRRRLWSALRLTQPPCPRVARGAGLRPPSLYQSVGLLLVSGATSERRLPPAVHRPAWGLARWTRQRAGRPCPTPFPPVTSRLPCVCALSRSDCAPLACLPRAALPRIGLGLRPRRRLRRQVGARVVLPDFAAHSMTTVPQSVCMARAYGAPRTSSPGPLRGCGFRACPCHTAFSPGCLGTPGRRTQEGR